MDLPDYYATLDVPRDADKSTIRFAFRRLARLHHPDAHPDDGAADEHFRQILEAHAVLVDPERRARYDALFDGGEDDALTGETLTDLARWPSFVEWVARYSPPR